MPTATGRCASPLFAHTTLTSDDPAMAPESGPYPHNRPCVFELDHSAPTGVDGCCSVAGGGA